MLFTFKIGRPLMSLGASVVWHHSLLLINGFDKTEAAVFSCRLCFLRAFHFISLLLSGIGTGKTNALRNSPLFLDCCYFNLYYI